MTDNEKLLEVARQKAAVAYAREKLDECIIGIRAIKADGMPHGSSSADGIPNTIAARDRAQRELEREEKRLVQVREEARRVIMRKSPPEIRFCMLRYLDGLGMKEIKKRLRGVAGCSERMLDRMRKEIEGNR